MCKIAMFANENAEPCDFFDASRLLMFEKKGDRWAVTGEAAFEKVLPSSPARTRKRTEELLPALAGCDLLAGGALAGIPYSVFDMAGLHIFEIGAADDAIFDEMAEDVRRADSERNIKERIIAEARPVETGTPGIYALDLIALQRACPEMSSKKALADFLESAPFAELRLTCAHIPPWIEIDGRYDIRARKEGGAVKAVITRRCEACKTSNC
jgi:hypothetical protein